MLKIELRSIDSLQPYFRNPRRNDHAVQQMVASIREYGFKIRFWCAVTAKSSTAICSSRRLMRRPILNHTQVGELVYDPFLGSGTTLAAEATERVCYGVELDAKYADVVIQRWQGMAGKTARLEGTKGRSKQWRRNG